MIKPELVYQDGLYDVRQGEADAKKDLEARARGLSGVINLGRRTLAMRAQPGYQDFVKAVEDLHTHALRQMVACKGTDSQLRQLQGKAQALNDVLAVLVKVEHTVETLEKELKGVQNALETANNLPRSGGADR